MGKVPMLRWPLREPDKRYNPPMRVIGGGNFIVDYVKTIDHYPVEQTLADIRLEYSGSGGAPYNVLLNLAKLGSGFELSAIGRIGEDEAGKYILADLEDHQIDASGLVVTGEAPTSHTFVMVAEKTGKRTFFHQRGANALLDATDFDFTGLSGNHLHYGYLLLLDKMDADDGAGVARVLAKAKASGLTTSIDLVSEDSDRFSRVVTPALEFCDLAFMNEFEASRLTGVALVEAGVFRADRVCQARRALDFQGTLVLHWEDGAASCDASGVATWQGSVNLPASEIASVVGSGDAFAAGYLLAHLLGRNVKDCLRLGVCAAAACVRGYTCTDAMISQAECLSLGEHHGFRAVE
jgi:sugar/nucleoside kinase (ribokinase family)